jgi:hypothetical protein
VLECVKPERDRNRDKADQPEHADLQNFINHALTGVLLAVAYFRFKETMKPFLSKEEIGEAFLRMAQNKAKNVVDHWHEPPEPAAE